MTKNEILDEVFSFVKEYRDHKYNQFYIGITSNVDSRLFSDHKVEELTNEYIYRIADSEDVAREVERYFLALGMDGGTGGGTGDGNVKVVYCFKKMFYTNPKESTNIV